MAASWGHIELVRYLLENGANSHILEGWGLERKGPQVCGNEPWQDTYSNRQYAPLELQLWQQSDRSTQGSALRAAVLNGQDEIARLLLQPPYCISTVCCEYFTALIATCRFGHIEMMQLLINTTKRDLLVEIPWLAEELLRSASYFKQTPMVQWLIDRGTNLNAPHSLRHHLIPCALSSACGQGNLPLVRLLLKHGARADYDHILNRAFSYNPIEIAARHGHLEIVELLLEHDGVSAETALAEAASGNQTHIITWFCRRDASLLSHKLSQHCDSLVGDFALSMAISHLNRTMAEILVSTGRLSLDKPDCYSNRHRILYAKTSQGPLRTIFLLSLGAKDVEVPEEEIRKDDEIHYRSGEVYISERSREWAGRC